MFKKLALAVGIALLASPLVVLATSQPLPDDYGTGTTGVYCPNLTSTFQKGARDSTTGGQVSELQAFLSDYYNLDDGILVGGYFGKLTQKYVVQFQTEQNLPAFGIVGSLTRAKIAEACDGSTSDTLTVTLQSGTAPLTVQFGLNTSNSGNTYTLDFGDGSAKYMTTSVGRDGVSHTYGSPGSYTATLSTRASGCAIDAPPIGPCTPRTISTVTVTVSGSSLEFTQLDGDVYVAQDDGSFTPFPDQVSEEALTKRFLATHPDQYDFISIFTTYPQPAGQPPGGAFVVNNTMIKGIGSTIGDYSANFGTRVKLKAAPLLNDIELSSMGGLAHEISHYWIMYIQNTPDLQLSRDGAHWSNFMDTAVRDAEGIHLDLNGGDAYKDNGDGTFSHDDVFTFSSTAISALEMRFNSMDLYLMGFLSPSEVRPLTLWQTDALQFSGRVVGTKRTVTVQDVIQKAGPRVPAYPDTQKSFRVAYILLPKRGQKATAVQTDSILSMAKNFPGFWERATGGRSKIESGGTNPGSSVDLKFKGSDGPISMQADGSQFLVTATSQNVSSCVLNQTGPQPITNQSFPTTYSALGAPITSAWIGTTVTTIACTTPSGGSVSDSVTLIVEAPLSPQSSVDINFNGSDDPITWRANGTQFLVTLSAQNVSSCVLNQTGPQPISNQSVATTYSALGAPITSTWIGTTRTTITCTTPSGGTVSDSATLNVVAPSSVVPKKITLTSGSSWTAPSDWDSSDIRSKSSAAEEVAVA